MVPGAHDGTLKPCISSAKPPGLRPGPQPYPEEPVEPRFSGGQDIFLTETAQLADVVLPAVCFAEKEGRFEHRAPRAAVRKAVDPPGQARQDWEIICDIATRMGYPMSYATAKP